MNYIVISKILDKMISNTKGASTTLKVRLLDGLIIDKTLDKCHNTSVRDW